MVFSIPLSNLEISHILINIIENKKGTQKDTFNLVVVKIYYNSFLPLVDSNKFLNVSVSSE